MAISETNKSGMISAYAGTTGFNSTEAQINKHIQDLNTTFIGKVTDCTSNGVNGSKTVTAINLIQQIDAEGNALNNVNISDLPHYRLQAGIGAVILDPVADDIGVFSCAKRDISNISQNNKDTQVPASFRQFSPSDAVMTGTIHTKTPEVYIHIQQDKTITVVCPNGYKSTTEQTHEINANKVVINAQSIVLNAQNIELNAQTLTVNANLNFNGDVAINGALTASGVITSNTDVVSASKSFNSHVHGGIMPGSSNTGVPA